MENVTYRRTPRILILCAMGVALCGAQESESKEPGVQQSEGAAVYETSCASCHDGGAAQAPRLEVLHQMAPERVVEALLYGSMRPQGKLLRQAQQLAVARFVAGKDFGAEDQQVRLCSDAPGVFVENSANGHWNGWGASPDNRRFQSTEAAGLAAADVPKLRLKWAFALPFVTRMFSQPTIVGGRIFIGGRSRKVHALDAKSGCAYWVFEATANVRGAVSVGPRPGSDPQSYAAFFVDVRANAYSVDAETGRLLWKTKVDESPVARATGSPLLHEGRMYVPLTASEDYLGAFPNYECCKSRGGVVAIDMREGTRIWKSETVTEPARPTRKNSRGTQLWGPSGAGVWSSPTLDTKLKRIYIATGNNYSDPATKTSDAVLALDLETGKIRWSRQFTENDAYNMSCLGTSGTRINCPQAKGPDLDFGASPILTVLPSGKRVLLAGQKSGMLHAMDPDDGGKLLWQVRVGTGGYLGGIQWGPAADGENVYVALSDVGRRSTHDTTEVRSFSLDSEVGGGMFAYQIATGEEIWHQLPVPCGDRPHCSPAQSAAVSVIPGVVFSGSMDGHIRAYSTQDGKVVWDFDTARKFETVNGLKGRGGSLDTAGPTIAGGMVFVNSGYGQWGGMPGNVVLAFSVGGE
jgi:polyvinyl alcohol dehydrogenase (cytochrome)